jgi:hypothetical protein
MPERGLGVRAQGLGSGRCHGVPGAQPHAMHTNVYGRVHKQSPVAKPSMERFHNIRATILP